MHPPSLGSFRLHSIASARLAGEAATRRKNGNSQLQDPSTADWRRFTRIHLFLASNSFRTSGRLGGRKTARFFHHGSDRMATDTNFSHQANEENEENSSPQTNYADGDFFATKDRPPSAVGLLRRTGKERKEMTFTAKHRFGPLRRLVPPWLPSDGVRF
jgi:hypothetical protein